MSYTEVKQCRACQGTDLTPVFDLGNQPLANNFVAADEPRQGFYPLKILLCRGCGLAQLSAVVNRDTLYKDYAYVSSSSDTMQRHYDRLFKDMESETTGKSIIEIGSNNGGLLQFAKERGFEVLGIDPAENLARAARKNSIPTVCEYFGITAARLSRNQLLKAPDIILARHVFAHVDDWREFMAGLEVMAGKDTLVCIEVPYAVDLLNRIEFDSVYHEHLSYVTLRPIVQLLQKTSFRIHRINRYGIHGGAILLMLRRWDYPYASHLSVDEMLAEEKVPEATWRWFADLAKQKIESLKVLVKDLRSQGKVVSAFGASAKATVLINACGFTTKDIAFVTDNSPYKPGKLIPGTDIPVVEEAEMLAMHPNYSIMTAWNFEAEILAKMEKWRKRGGKFIIPDKELRIV